MDSYRNKKLSHENPSLDSRFRCNVVIFENIFDFRSNAPSPPSPPSPPYQLIPPPIPPPPFLFAPLSAHTQHSAPSLTMCRR